MKKYLTSIILTLCCTSVAMAQGAPSIYDGCNPVTCVANTAYSGSQEINCVQLKDGSYALYDPQHNVYTVDGTYATLVRNGMSMGEQNSWHYEYDATLGDLMNKYFMLSSPITNGSTTWDLPPFDIEIDSLDVTVTNLDYDIFTNSTLTLEVTEANGETYPIEFACHNDEKVTVRLPHTITVNKSPFVKVELVIKTTDEDFRSTPLYLQLKPVYYNSGFMTFEDFTTMAIIDAYGKVSSMQGALDAHWGIGKTLEYYSEKFDRKSYDGKGSPVVNIISPQAGMPVTSMAFPVPDSSRGYIGVGMGTAMLMGDTPEEGIMIFQPCSALPVMGHEFTHLVNGSFSLNYECMGLAESFADIMSMNIYKYVTGETIWYIGGDFLPKEMNIARRFDTPAAMGYGECYDDENFREEDHYKKSTVQTHMYYLLVEGGKGVNSLGENYDVTPMKRDDAEALVYEVLTTHDFTDVTFPICRDMWIETATSKWGANSSQVASLKQAWAAVGLAVEPDAISEFKADNASASVYNMLGQKVSRSCTGIYIKNGRKYMTK